MLYSAFIEFLTAFKLVSPDSLAISCIIESICTPSSSPNICGIKY